MIEKEKHRTITLDLDVSPIASELASKRKLSSVLSELLRKEYGVNQEEDILNSQINELNRQQLQIQNDLIELKQIQFQKSRINKIKTEKIELEKEFQLLNLNMKQEIENALNDHESIQNETDLLPHEVMLKVAKEKRAIRLQITEKFNERKSFIISRLKELGDQEIENQ